MPANLRTTLTAAFTGFLITTGSGLAPLASHAQSAAPVFTPESLRQAVGSVVRVTAKIVPDGRTVGALGRTRAGSGVIIDATTVLTIGYLVVEADEVEILTQSGKRIPAALAGYDHESGFGVLRTVLPLDGKPMVLGDSDAIDERQPVSTLGHGETEATPLMTVSRRPFAGNWEYLLEKPLYTWPAVGNWSGSALLDAHGRLIGIGSLVVGDAAKSDPPVPGNLFVPVNLLKPILADLLRSGRRNGPGRPWLGLATDMREDRLVVTRVTPGGPAAKAGIEAGDVIVGVGPSPGQIDDLADFYRKVFRLGVAGDDIRLQTRSPDTGDEASSVVLKSIDRNDFLKRAEGI